jgi:hypothetical protein
MFVVVLWALFVSLYHLGDARISHDELKTLRMIAEHSPVEILTVFFSFSHVFFSLLLALVHQLTDKFYLLRLTPVLFGVLAVAMSYRTGQTLLGGRMALAAAYLLTVTPIFVQYLREMRGYSATVFFSLVALFSLWQGLATGRKRYWVGLVVASILGVYTHLYFAPVLLSVTVIVAGAWLRTIRQRRPSREILLPALASLAAVGAGLAILYGPIVGQVLTVPEEQTLRMPVFGPFTPTWDFLRQFVAVFGDFNPAGPSGNADLFLLLVLVGCVSGMIRPARRRPTLWLLAWWLAPFVGNLLLMELFPGTSAQIRFHLHTLPVYLLLGVVGLFALAEYLGRLASRAVPSIGANRLRRASWFGVTAILVLAVTIPVTIESLNEKTDEAWSAVGAYLRSEIAPGDVVLCEAFKLHGGRGGNDGSCGWQLKDVARLIDADLPNESLSYVSDYRRAEKMPEVYGSAGRVWFVIYFPGPPPYPLTELDQSPGVQVERFRSTWVVRVDTGETLLENLIETGEWLLRYVPEEKHQFGYHLDLAQLYALAGDLVTANTQLEQAYQIQQASADPDWAPELAELREVAAVVRYYAPADRVPQRQVNVSFDNRLNLLGYSLQPDPPASPAEVKLTLYWQLDQSLEEDHAILVHLRDGKGQTVEHFDFQPFDGILPTSVWPVGLEIREARRFSLPVGLPPGEYQVVIGLYLPDTLERLPVIDDASGENVVNLGSVVVPGS